MCNLSRDHQLISVVNLISWGSLNGDSTSLHDCWVVLASEWKHSPALKVDLSVYLFVLPHIMLAGFQAKLYQYNKVEVHAFLWASLSNHRASLFFISLSYFLYQLSFLYQFIIFSLSVKAVTKVYLGLSRDAFISPLDEKQCQSHSERRASWAKCACVAIFGKHHEPRPFRSIL